MRRMKKGLVFVGLVTLMSGCATNALRLEYAGNVASQGKISAAASKEYLGTVDASRVAANLDLIALDPDCSPNTAFLKISPSLSAIKDPKSPPRGWLCARTHVAGQTFETPISLAPIANELEPTFVMITALASYSEAISEILDQEAIDPGAEFEEALALGRAAEGLIVAVSDGAPNIPAADDPRVAAISGFLSFVGELAAEADKVKQLRLFAASEKGNGAIIAKLRSDLADWELSRKADENTRYLQTQLLLKLNLEVEPPLPSAQRRDVAKAYYDRAAAVNSSARLFSALDATLQELADADADLRRVLAEKPNLTLAEKRKIAQLNRARVIRALQALTDLVTSFRGA